MINVDVRFAPGHERRLLQLLDPRAMARAEAETVNRTAANVREKAHELVAEEMGLSPKKLRKRGRGVSTPQRATKFSGNFGTVSRGRKATPRTLKTGVTGYGRPFNAARWKGKPIQSGASQSISGKRRAKRGRGIVLATQHEAYGDLQVADRTWMLKNGAIVTRTVSGRGNQTFRGVYGPGVAQQLEKPRIMGPLQQHAQQQFLKHFRTVVAFAFSGTEQAAAFRSGIRGSRR